MKLDKRTDDILSGRLDKYNPELDEDPWYEHRMISKIMLHIGESVDPFDVEIVYDQKVEHIEEILFMCSPTLHLQNALIDHKWYFISGTYPDALIGISDLRKQVIVDIIGYMPEFE